MNYQQDVRTRVLGAVYFSSSTFRLPNSIFPNDVIRNTCSVMRIFTPGVVCAS